MPDDAWSLQGTDGIIDHKMKERYKYIQNFYAIFF
jgi:hypothetical protein